MRTVLPFHAHPDDEVLLTGAKHEVEAAADPQRVSWLLTQDNLGSRPRYELASAGGTW